MSPTAKQLELLRFIADQVATGIGPSIDEMKIHLGLRSKTGAAVLLARLEERGLIRRLYNRARAVELTSEGQALTGQACHRKRLPNGYVLATPLRFIPAPQAS